MAMIDVTEKPSVSINITPGDATIINEDVYESVESKPKRKKSTKKKTEKVGDIEIVTGEDDTSDLPMTMSNQSYKDTYMETDNILRTAVTQLDEAAIEIGEDIDEIRSSKTLRKKYDYIAALQSSRATVISTKVSAAREMNNSIKNSHELELKRAKEMKLNEDTDDVKSIQDMYNAFVSMPVSENMIGPFTSPLGVSTQGLTMNSNAIAATTMGIDQEAGYNNFMNNMSQEQAIMMIEENPHINHVVAYDPNTGSASFAVYDSQSNRFLNNIPTRNNEMFMPNMKFDFENMQASNNNLNETYDIVDVNKVNGTANGMDVIKNGSKNLSNY